MKKKISFVLVSLLMLSGSALMVEANHSWGKYHWDLSTANTIADPLNLGDNLTTAGWASSLVGASTDWNASVIKNEIVAGGSNVNCDPTAGSVEVCNAEYGNNGWLGIASIWATRGKSAHITQGVVKVNDTYFNLPQYNTQEWRNFVMCQEVGHTFGLGHQDENFLNTNLGSCMDYTDDPTGLLGTNGTLNNEHPNTHDYDELASIYAHLNETDGGGSGSGKGGGNGGGNGKGKPADVGATIDFDNPSTWGEVIRRDANGNPSVYRKNLGNSQEVITHVLWADGHHQD